MTACSPQKGRRARPVPRKGLTAAALAGFGAGLFAIALMGAPRGAEAQDYSGYYVGPEVGYIHSKDRTIGKVDGAYFGGFLGIRDQLPGGLVFGGEFSVGGSTQDKAFMGADFDSGRFVALDGVLGIPVQDGVLLFGNVGYQNFKLRGERDGIRYGGGIEWRLGEITSARIKVNYSNFDGIKTLTSNAGLLVRF